jgi:hypothetical protein
MAELSKDANDACESNICVCSQIERERILAEIGKLKPFIDEQGQANWYRHAAYVRAIKGNG